MNRLILKFNVDTMGQAEVMAIGKAITEQLQSAHKVGLVGVEYVWDKPEPVLEKSAPVKTLTNGKSVPLTNGKSKIHTGTRDEPKLVGSDEGFIPEKELEASKRFKNGK
jgi:hypothetical protein